MKRSSLLNDIPELNIIIDNAILDPYLDESEINIICDSIKHFSLKGVSTHSGNLPLIRKRMGPSKVTKILSVIGFPFGTIPIEIKRLEAEWALENGADELELSPNISLIKQNNLNQFSEEIAEICELGIPTKVILNMANLNSEFTKAAIEASIDAGAIGIQNSNGFGPPSKASEIAKLKELAKGRCSIKAVGGIQTLEHAFELIEAGADSIGTSHGIQLMQSFKRGKY